MIADLHHPYFYKKGFRVLLDIIKDINPDYYIDLGDNIDFDMISTYSNKKPKKTENKRILKTYQAYDKEILQPLNEALSDSCKKIYIRGNHNHRVDRYVNYYPITEGIIEEEHNLDLSDWEVIEYNKPYILGDTCFIHGHYHNRFHTKKHLDIYNMNVIYGHLHCNQSYTRATPIEQQPLTAMSIGTMGTLNPEWLSDMPNSWQNQMLTFNLYGNRIYPCVSTFKKDKIFINGKLYSG